MLKQKGRKMTTTDNARTDDARGTADLLTSAGAVIDLSPRLKEFTLRTDALATAPGFPFGGDPAGLTRVRVLLPVDYDHDAERRYPVLYLLHGGGDDYASWTTPDGKGDAEAITGETPLIVVMPDGGTAGGYADWYNDGRFGAPRWAAYHLDQLVPWVDANFRTIADRTGRAAAGLSMGGAAVRYAAQRPDLFGVAAAFSGDVDIMQPESGWRGAGSFVARQIWGDPDADELRWRAVNGPDLAINLRNTDVSIYTGDEGEPEGTFIKAGSEALHARLDDLEIDHEFTLYEGMSHEWATWNRALREWLPHLSKTWSELDAHPSGFAYISIADAFSIFGWDVALTRAAAGFSSLEVAAPGSFVFTGAGSAIVTTPPLTSPSGRVRVTSAYEDNLTTVAELRADEGGRAAVALELDGAAGPESVVSVGTKATVWVEPLDG